MPADAAAPGQEGAEDALAWEVCDRIPEAAARVVDAGLDAHNRAAAKLEDVRPLACFARDASGAVVGGAVGRTWGGCCQLLQLWVAQSHRGRGVGSGLLRRFEAHAHSRGCRTFYLETLSFQAPRFYAAHGYRPAATLRGYPAAIEKYLMVKEEASPADRV